MEEGKDEGVSREESDRTIGRWNEGVGVGGGDAKTRNPN